MASKRVKVRARPGEPLKDAELIEVNEATERWNEYQLSDGTVIRLKVVVVEVSRIEGEYDADGNPSYIMKSGNIMTVNSPDNLRKQEPE